jgi:hypothetical protein
MIRFARLTASTKVALTSVVVALCVPVDVPVTPELSTPDGTAPLVEAAVEAPLEVAVPLVAIEVVFKVAVSE